MSTINNIRKRPFIEKISIFGFLSAVIFVFLDWNIDMYWDVSEMVGYVGIEFLLLFIVFGDKKPEDEEE